MRKKMMIGILGLVALSLLGDCGGAKSRNQSPARENTKDSHAKEVTFPKVPASITDPAERAGYAVAHFWDALDPADHSMSLDSAFMEQTFANFIGLLPYASDEARSEGVSNFADRCAQDSAVYDLAAHIARHYLDDPNSPLRDEELYILFLERFSADPRLSEGKRERAAYRLEQATKNRPGTRASDFRMLTREGRTTTLLRELKDTTLVLFYDYDCEHCKETVRRLQDPATGLRYPVMAVEVTEDRERWEATKSGMPAGWTVCFSLDEIDGESYYFPALPSLYLLTSDGTVLVKDGTI